MVTRKKVKLGGVPAVVAIILMLLFGIFGSFFGYAFAIAHLTQPPKPEPFTINGYTSESDFEAVLAETTMDRFNAEFYDRQNMEAYLNSQIADLKDQNRLMKAEMQSFKTYIDYLVRELQKHNITISGGY